MEELSSKEKERIIDFIDKNELYYEWEERDTAKFRLFAEDGNYFQFFKNNENIIVCKFDKSKFRINAACDPYEYYQFSNLQQVLEQIKLYDSQIFRNFWIPTTNTVDYVPDKTIYENKKWIEEFKIDENWKIIEEGKDYILVYENFNIQPELKSHFNTLHEVSPINQLKYEKVHKLYFEIHPISVKKRNEKYLFKLLINNEEVLKEYASFNVFKKRGLHMLIKSIFESIKK